MTLLLAQLTSVRWHGGLLVPRLHVIAVGRSTALVFVTTASSASASASPTPTSAPATILELDLVAAR